MEVKSTPYAIKQITDRTVIGIASVFGNVDDMLDIVWPGAYQKTIQENRRRIRHLWMHDGNAPPTASLDDLREVSIAELPDSIKQMAPTAIGGLQITRTYLDTPRGNEVLAGIKSGAINEGSIGYDAVKFDFNEVDGQQVRNLRELRLWDTSDVNWGANDATDNLAKALKLSNRYLLTQLQALIAEIKSGARHSSTDVKLLNSIHKAVLSLGATNCKGSTDDGDEGEEDNPKQQDTEKAAEHEDDKSRAGTEAVPLTLMRDELALLELEVFATVGR